MKNISHILALGMILLAVTSVQAQTTYTATGGDALIQEVLSEVELPDGNTLAQVAAHGFIWTNEENVVGGNGSWECRGSIVMSPEGDPLDGNGTCDGLDTDGDIFWISWRGGNGGEFDFARGTGKYAGIEGGGTWKPSAQYPDGKTLNEWEGTWTIPAHEMADPGME